MITQDFISRLIPITDVAIEVAAKNPAISVLNNVLEHTQLTFYWWKTAGDEMNTFSESITLIAADTEGKESLPKAPFLHSGMEQLHYMDDHMESLCKDVYEFLESTSLPPSVKYKMEQGYNKLMEAGFFTKIAIMYYGQYSKYAART